MILKMTLATVLYVAATTLLWLIWRRRERKGLGMKIFIGLIYGGCSVLSNHFGIDSGKMLLNVRDIGPLAAGLFFDPLSGILAGVIGGVERYLVGEFLDIGYFTRIACGVSTCLAGFLAAALHVWIYQKERPTVVHSFFLGAVMEVFHMYAILLTNREELYDAYYVVRTVSFPMILFTAAGVALCSAIVLRLSDEYDGFHLFRPKAETPVFTQVQRWLLVVTAGVFAISTGITYQMQTRSAYQTVRARLMIHTYELEALYERTKDIASVRQQVNSEFGENDTIYVLINRNTGIILNDGAAAFSPTGSLTKEDEKKITSHLDANSFVTDLALFEHTEMLCSAALLDNRYYLLVMSPTSLIYEDRNNKLTENILADILLFTALYVLFAILVERMMSRKLALVNAGLARITSGHLDEKIDVRSSSEFSALSDDINTTVTALQGYIEAAMKRMEEDLRLAAAIQESALPRNFELPGDSADLYALMTPARHVGGDFYDFFYLDDMNTLCLVIADVSGKGIPASLFMMRAKTAIKNNSFRGFGPGELMALVNNILCEGNDAEMFVTVWVAMIDMKTGVARCANAGHEYPVLAPDGGEYALVKDKHGLVLAAMEGARFREYTLELHPGDRLYVYTDGVPEAINEKEEAYGSDRLVQKLNEYRAKPEEETLNAVLQDIRDFAGEAEQFDDITMIGFTFRGEK